MIRANVTSIPRQSFASKPIPIPASPTAATALKKLYEGAHDSKGKQIFPGFVPGAEEGEGGWDLWITGNEPGKALLFAFGSGFFGNMVYAQADWDYKKAKLDEAVDCS